MNNEEIVIYGDGEQTRDFVYVKDTADAAVKTYNNNSSRGKVLNIASGQEITMNTIVKSIATLMDYKKDILYRAARPGDVMRHLADISLARELIGYDPKTKFEDGIKETVDWYKKNTDWWQKLKSGKHLEYFKKQYQEKI